MKRFISIICSLCVAISCLATDVYAASSTDDNTYIESVKYTEPDDSTQTGESDATDPVYVTRIEWLHELIEAFNLSVDESKYPDNYFCDIDSTSEYYYDVMCATEYGLIDVAAGYAVEPELYATREFATHTLNMCMGYALEDKTYSFDEYETVKYPDDIQIAVNYEWFELEGTSFLPEQNVTAEEKDNLIEIANEEVSLRTIDTSYENSYSFKDDVIVLPEDIDAVLTVENEITFHNLSVELLVGDKFALISDDFPVVKKVVSIKTSGTDTIIETESVSSEDAFEDIDLQGSLQADLSQVQATDAESQVYYATGGTAEKKFEDAKLFDSPEDIQSGEISAVVINKTYDIPEAIRNKFGLPDGVDATITCTISDVVADYDVDWGNAYFKSTSTITFNCNVSTDILEAIGVESDIVLAKVPILYVGFISANLDLELEGSITLNFVEKVTAGLKVDKNGLQIIKNFQKESFYIEAKIEGAVGVSLKIGIDLIILEADIYAKIGAQAYVSEKTYLDGKTPNECDEVAAWMYASVGCEATLDYFFGEKEWDKELIPIFDQDNSPVRLFYHYEDGVSVSKCTRDDEDEDDDSTTTDRKYKKYYTPASSQYGYNGASSGVDDKGQTFVTFEYSLNNGLATITKYNGNQTSINVPSTLDGYKVVSIGSKAFASKAKLQYVNIADTITSIGNEAFNNCTNLKTVVLPSNLVSLERKAFGNCIALTNITIPKTLTESNTTYEYLTYDGFDGPFSGCTNLNKATIENRATSVAKCLFAGCQGLESVVIPNTVTSIGRKAFAACPNLKSVNIPEGVTEIGLYAFINCTSLTEITIPKSVVKSSTSYEYLDYDGFDGPFYGCSNLKKATIAQGATTIATGLFAGCTSLETVVIPNTVTSIGSKAFGECTSLKSMDIPDSVTSIGLYAFIRCTSLSELTLSSNIKSIERQAFGACNKLTEIVIPKSLAEGHTDYDNLDYTGYNGPFYKCNNLKKATFENGTTKIANCIFAGCTGLENVIIPDSVTTIGDKAFGECTALKSINIPDSVTSIGRYAFIRCTKLSNVKLSSYLQELGAQSFGGCNSLETITIPKSLTTCHTSYDNLVDTGYDGPFNAATALNTIVFEEGIKTIPGNLFAGCTGLTSIVIPETVTSIGSKAFGGCSNLESITLPDNITELKDCLFRYCSALTDVDIPDSVNKIGNYAFRDSGLKSINISSVITSIGTMAFSGSSLESVIFDDNCTSSVGCSAFSECYSLNKAYLGKKVSKIDDYAFATVQHYLQLLYQIQLLMLDLTVLKIATL